MSEDIINIINLHKRFGKKSILKDINLGITSGEIFGIIGRSGSGKTTLLNILIGFLQPDAGDVRFKIEHLLSFQEGTDQFKSVYTNDKVVKMTFGFAAQTPSVYSKLTCMENLNYFGKLYNLPASIRKTNIEILLKLMDLYESRNVPAGFLSGGMKKRLDIACALIHDPKILILDEPTSDLDPMLRKQMWGLIKQINDKGTTIILTSHYLEDLDRFCSRVAILHNAEIMALGSPSEVKKCYVKQQDIRLETESHDYSKFMDVLESKRDHLEISSTAIENNKMLITTTKSDEVIKELLREVKDSKDDIIDMTVEDPSLEYVLEMITSKKK